MPQHSNPQHTTSPSRGPNRHTGKLTGRLPAQFSRTEAHRLGVSDESLRTLRRRGLIERIGFGQYAQNAPVADATQPPHQARAARHLTELRAALATHPGHVASHLSAALVHGLALPRGSLGAPQLTAISTAPRSRRNTRTIGHHCDSGPTEVTMLGDLTLTSVTRTVADCLRMTSPLVSVPLADSAIRRHGVTVEQIEGELAQQVRWVGRPLARRTLHLVDGRRESWLESFSFAGLALNGLTLPTPQVEVFDDDGVFIGRVDGLWIEQQCAAETDGKLKYNLREGETIEMARRRVMLAEKAREEALRRIGIRTIRWGTDEATADITRLARRVRRELTLPRLGPLRGSLVIPDATGHTKLGL